MGLASSWLAVRGKPSEGVLRELGLTPTGERDELPAESPIAAIELDTGWYVVVFDGEPPEEKIVRDLSTGCEVVCGAVEEHVMYSAAEQWSDRERIWRAVHDAQEGIRHFQLDGAPPADFDVIRKRRFEEQETAGGDDADVDYIFDIPTDIAQLVTGFSYDLEPDDGFAVLRKTG